MDELTPERYAILDLEEELLAILGFFKVCHRARANCSHVEANMTILVRSQPLVICKQLHDSSLRSLCKAPGAEQIQQRTENEDAFVADAEGDLGLVVVREREVSEPNQQAERLGGICHDVAACLLERLFVLRCCQMHAFSIRGLCNELDEPELIREQWNCLHVIKETIRR